MKDLRRNDRRWTSDYYVLFDRESGEAIGRVLNFSENGLLIMSAEQIPIPHLLRCRMTLPRPVDGRSEVLFDAESRWGRHNEKSDWFETGLLIVAMPAGDRAMYERLVRESPETRPAPHPPR